MESLRFMQMSLLVHWMENIVPDRQDGDSVLSQADDVVS